MSNNVRIDSRQAIRISASSIYIGIVRKNDDPQKMGRLSVWIPEMGGAYDDESSWFIVSYASPFAGVTDSDDLRKDAKDMAGTQKSYGMWMVPPDIGNQVLVAFINGDSAKGFWFACVWQQNMNHMVPAIPSNVPTDPSLQNGVEGNLPPVAEYNKWSGVNPDDPQRPVYEPLHEALKTQGLYSDAERGPSSTGARRESPSKVFGLLTPGGHSMSFDDKEGIFRIRMIDGPQIMISNKTGYIYAVTKKGNSWLELSDEGIDAYTKADYSIHAEGNINFRAEKDIIFDAGGNIFGRAGAKIGLESGAEFNTKAGAALAIDAAGNIGVKAAGAINQSAGGNITEKAGGNHIRSASEILDNSGSAPNAPEVAAQKGGTLSGVETTVARMPTHEPWPYHPKEGLSSDEDAPTVTEGNGGGGEKEQSRALRNITTGSGATRVMDKSYKDSSPTFRLGQHRISQNVLDAIKEGSNVSGMDLGYMLAKAGQESGFDPNIKAKTSSATGLYQFTDSTWRGMVRKYGAKYGIGMDDRQDPRANAIMGGLFARDNAAYLRSRGLPTSNTDLYMAHFLGAGGAAKFLTARQRDPNGPAYASVGPAAAKANRSIFYDRSGNPRSNAQVYALFESKIEPASRAYAQAYGNQS